MYLMYPYDGKDEGWLELANVDNSENYSVDQAKIFDNGKKYLLATASGCSCWAGEWDIEEFDTLAKLEVSLKNEDRKYYAAGDSADELMRQARDAVVRAVDRSREALPFIS